MNNRLDMIILYLKIHHYNSFKNFMIPYIIKIVIILNMIYNIIKIKYKKIINYLYLICEHV